MKYTPILYVWKKYLYHRGSQWIFQSILVSGIIPGGKEEDKARQAVTPLNPFGRDPEEEKPNFVQQFLKQHLVKPKGNATKMLCIGYD